MANYGADILGMGLMPRGATAAQAQGISSEQAALLGKTAANQIYELQRRRLAAQGQGAQRSLAGFYAGRGGGASTAAASSIERQLAAERDALADASLQAQLQGRQIGTAEAQRLFDQNQFNAQLQQAAALANLQSRTQFALQQLGGQQQYAMARWQEEQRRRAQRGGLFGKILGGVANIGLGFLPGGGALKALGGLFGGGGEPPGYQYNDPSQPWLGGSN